MKNFNLLISTSRFNEINAKAEAWYLLLICGDKYPIISNLEYLGLITAYSDVEPKKVFEKIREITRINPNFFQYILKIVPIDFVCETNLNTILEIVKNNYRNYIKQEERFRIKLRRRKHSEVSRDLYIKKIAHEIKNPVDLGNPDKILRIEILGNFTGLSFHSPNEIIRFRKKSQEF